MKNNKRTLGKNAKTCEVIFNRFYRYCLILITAFSINFYVNAQCNYDNTLDTTWTAPASIGDSVFTTCIYGGKFIRVTGMVAGDAYMIATCGNPNFDAQITIYPAGGGSYIAYNAYGCGNQSIINFIPANNGNYDILINEYYCAANTICMYLVVKKIPCPEVNANIYISPNPVCPNDIVYFDAWGDAGSFVWNFGDGSPTSSNQYTNHTYTSVGNYSVSLTLTNGCGNDTILYDTVEVVNNLPVANAGFNIYPNPVCPNDEVSFSGWGDAGSFVWNFGDSSPTSSNQYTNHIYDSTGSYYVTLTLTNNCGNDTTLYDTVEVVNNLPVANAGFNIYPNPVCPNDEVYFSGWGDAGSFVWNFGDGSPTSNNQYTNHAYTSVGSYPVSLTLTNNCGNDTTLYDTVEVVNNLPVANAGFNIYPNPVCPNDAVFFSGWGDAGSFVWNFGDGSPTSSNQYTNHTYTSVGNYSVSLTLTNGCGNDTILYDTVEVVNNLPVANAGFNIYPNPVCPNDEVSFSGWGDAISFVWNFGDGSPTSNNQYTNHTYASLGNYSVSLTLTNGCGNDTTLYDTVNVVNNLPVANAGFNISPNPVCPGDIVYFDAWGNAGSFVWNFGDGSPTSNNSYTNHTYASVGNYSVSLTLTNGCGNDTILYETVNVANNVIPDPFNYNYGTIPDEACPGDTVIFYVAPSGNSYLLDFGDSTSTTLFTQFDDDGYIIDIAKHTYSNIGNYTLTFTLTNGCGNYFTDSFSIVIGNNIPVDGWFWWNDVDPTVGENIEFFALGGASYQWNFGDGSAIVTTTSSFTPVIHSYSLPGTYTISVTITNSCANFEIYTDNITIDTTVGIQENKLSGNIFLRIYPNPNNGTFSLEIENTGKENLMIEIINICGQHIYSKQYINVYKTVKEINLSNHAKGIYFVKVQSKNNISVKKLIIQ